MEDGQKKKVLKEQQVMKKVLKQLEKITTHCSALGVKYLTLYAFSTENWTRPKLEVEFLMKLLDSWLKKELESYLENSTKFKAIGDISRFSKKLQKTIRDTEEKTKNGKNLTQVLALNYGSHDEMLRAMKKLKRKRLRNHKRKF